MTSPMTGDGDRVTGADGDRVTGADGHRPVGRVRFMDAQRVNLDGLPGKNRGSPWSRCARRRTRSRGW